MLYHTFFSANDKVCSLLNNLNLHKLFIYFNISLTCNIIHKQIVTEIFHQNKSEMWNYSAIKRLKSTLKYYNLFLDVTSAKVHYHTWLYLISKMLQIQCRRVVRLMPVWNYFLFLTPFEYLHTFSVNVIATNITKTFFA